MFISDNKMFFPEHAINNKGKANLDITNKFSIIFLIILQNV